MERKKLIGLQTSAYEHPFDREALKQLKKLKGFDSVMSFFLNWTQIKWDIVALQGSNFQVTRESCPELYKLAKDVQKTLDVDLMPLLYTEWSYDINGYTTGWDDSTLMVLNSGTVDLLNDSQLRYVVGHEFGHIKSGHVIYHALARVFGQMMTMVPGLGNLGLPLYYALQYWSRMSEFSADRAGLLATQDIDACIEAMMKMAGVPLKEHEKIAKETFLRQAREFTESMNGLGGKAIKAAMIAGSSHPWVVMRASELLKWYESGEYDKVLSGVKTNVCVNRRCGEVLPEGTEVCPYCGTKQK